MNLLQLRQEVLNTGFDQTQYGSRITQFLNDGQNRVARYMDWYGEEAAQLINTVAGTSVYAWPANMARVRELFDTNANVELDYVGLMDIDRSTATSGPPRYFAIDGPNIHLFPTPDSVGYALELRYWALPPAMVNDTDTPAIPADYSYVLINYALWKCYERDDDPQMAQYHETEFKKLLAEMKTDLMFPTSQEPVQIQGMWNRQRSLNQRGWSLWAGWDY